MGSYTSYWTFLSADMANCSTFLIIKDKFLSIPFSCFNKFSHSPNITIDKLLELNSLSEKISNSLPVVVN